MRRSGRSRRLSLARACAVAAAAWVAAACAGQVREPAPEPAPSPSPSASPASPDVVPPAEQGDAVPECAVDADCVVSPFATPIAAVADCYCPPCSVPLPRRVAARNEESWRRHCGTAWAAANPCGVPVCPRPPGPPACRSGRCGWAFERQP